MRRATVHRYVLSLRETQHAASLHFTFYIFRFQFSVFSFPFSTLLHLPPPDLGGAGAGEETIQGLLGFYHTSCASSKLRLAIAIWV